MTARKVGPTDPEEAIRFHRGLCIIGGRKVECPNCKFGMEPLKELSRGMGNQDFFKCPFCGTVVLCSGENITKAGRLKATRNGV